MTDQKVGWWMAVWAVMLLGLVVIGGITRLTDSGLSITEWRPVTGVIPPLDQSAWQREFDKYQQIPEFRLQNSAMTLAGFKRIYWWEYGHRLWARLVGLALALPLAWFWWRGGLSRRLKWRLTAVLALTGLQGAMGWYMVRSGLTVRTDVSQYRLAAHLALALALIALTVWTAAQILWPARSVPERLGPRGAALGWTALVSITAVAGALVAGLDAGKVYNEFPLMGGRLIPAGYRASASWWTNAGSNVIAVQFHHRVLAAATLVSGLWLAVRLTPRQLDPGLRRLGWTIAGLVAVQFGLGVATLLTSVRIELAVLHQAGAVLLFSVGVLLVHRLDPRGPNDREPSAAGPRKSARVPTAVA
jgi:cytochrome c oxidase assembly protein subunit 15